MSFAGVSKAKAKKWVPRVIVLGKGNRIVNKRGI
jgi:aspartate 1-decarboxylase